MVCQFIFIERNLRIEVNRITSRQLIHINSFSCRFNLQMTDRILCYTADKQLAQIWLMQLCSTRWKMDEKLTIKIFYLIWDIFSCLLTPAPLQSQHAAVASLQAQNVTIGHFESNCTNHDESKAHAPCPRRDI